MQLSKSAQNSLAVKSRTQRNVTLPIEGASIPIARWPWRQNVLPCPQIFLNPQYWLCFLSSFSGSESLGLLLNFSKIRASLFPSSVVMSASFCSSIPLSEQCHVSLRCLRQHFIMPTSSWDYEGLTAMLLKIRVFWDVTSFDIFVNTRWQ